MRLVHRFYKGVAGDAPLRALYPEPELADAEERLRLFLEQYWGGPTTYSDQRGHPRLRMRHAPFAVTPDQRDRWLHAHEGGRRLVGVWSPSSSTISCGTTSSARPCAMVNTFG